MVVHEEEDEEDDEEEVKVEVNQAITSAAVSTKKRGHGRPADSPGTKERKAIEKRKNSKNHNKKSKNWIIILWI